MSKYWLKMIGTANSPCPDRWTETYVHFPRKIKSIRPGDRMVLYAVGGKKCVFALAEVTSEVYQNENTEWPYQVDVRYIINLLVSSGVPIGEVNTPNRDLLKSLRQSSYIQLTSEEYQRAEAALWKKASVL